MPLRYTSTGAALLYSSRPSKSVVCRRLFHTSPRALRADDALPNHYETLDVHPNASPAEIKKSFYLLSKRHHPDHNPSDPSSPSRFMRISEAYAVLGHADKRARYDRDVMRRPLHGNPHFHHGHGHTHKGPRGSYHSTGPAGGRPASGLSSRRRGTFQGPPPSFFRSGGWGAHGAKRRAAHEESTGYYGAGYGTDSSPGGGGSGGAAGPRPGNPHSDPSSDPQPGSSAGTGGMGPGQDPYGHRDDVPHFDREAHERAQRRGDERRAERMAEKKGVRLEPEPGAMAGFWAVAGILAVVLAGTVVVNAVSDRLRTRPAQEKGKEKGKKAK
ncbi:DnaJ subfamily A member 3, mitochondrial [Madurella mycetomatis]|uniref:DnaJ subfamily A member 3, mitochondrial n=1 Tax=Madurella mycetomatis TaxID=100816 RepID=A0A175VWG1_9PEZI|nr:DnaJ subfamily A member 3, mitochondrial [Madurella mycetomatis]KXX77698.1 DnaJ subfamily A member 3, mitochondrial [Madurella mycetomatis]